MCTFDYPLQVFADFAGLMQVHEGSDIYIDVPIGLPSTRERGLEKKVRQILSGRSSSVFPVPVREAVYAEDYASACRVNQSVTGKKITLQAWHICQKIREVDEWACANPSHKAHLHESHPELVFQQLNGGQLEHPKKTRPGIDERLSVLDRFLPDSRQRFDECVASYLRKEVARDDIVDAMALHALGGITRAVLDDGADERGIEINMTFPKMVVD